MASDGKSAIPQIIIILEIMHDLNRTEHYNTA